MSTATAQRPSQKTVIDQEEQSRILDAMVEETMKKQTVSWKTQDTQEDIELSISGVRKLFGNPTKKGKMPSDRDCWMFLQLCKARGLNPYLGDAFLVGYDEDSGPKFTLITSHQAIMKRAEKSGVKDGMESGVTVMHRDTKEIEDLRGDFYSDDRHILVCGWCRVFRKDQEVPTFYRLKLSVFDKKYGQWSKNPGGMIVKCAEASAHRLAFPNETAGMFINEEFKPESDIDDTPVATRGVEGIKNRLGLTSTTIKSPPPTNGKDEHVDEPEIESDLEPEHVDEQTEQDSPDDRETLVLESEVPAKKVESEQTPAEWSRAGLDTIFGTARTTMAITSLANKMSTDSPQYKEEVYEAADRRMHALAKYKKK